VPWAGVDSDGVSGSTQVARWVAMVSMVTKLLHHHTDVLAQMCVHFCGERGVHRSSKQVSWAPVHAGVYIPQVFLTSPYIFVTQSLAATAGCAHALVYAQLVHSHLGTRVGGFT